MLFQEFEYSASAKGYWTYVLIILQPDDCDKILKSLHPVIYFVFEFVHSFWHDKEIEDGLNVTNMKIEYDGENQEIHPRNSRH